MGAGVSVGAGSKKKGSGIGGPKSKGMFAFLKQMDKKGATLKGTRKSQGAGVSVGAGVKKKRGGMHMMSKAGKKAMFEGGPDWWKGMSKTAIRNEGNKRRARAKKPRAGFLGAYPKPRRVAISPARR